MVEATKRTEEFFIDTEEEKDTFIETLHQNESTDGYTIVKYSSTLKQKMKKGEIIDSYYVVSVTKKFPHSREV